MEARPDVRLWLLRGELGTGKTTAVRGVLRHLGVRRSVTSPTYTLRQEYVLPTSTQRLIHVDAYRFRTPSEAEGVGLLDDLENPKATIWIEWPERLAGLSLPPAGKITLSFTKGGRTITWRLPAVAKPLV